MLNFFAAQYTAFSKRRMSASPEDLVQLKRSKFAESDANSTSVLQLHACEGYEAPHCISCQSPGQSSVEECRFAGFRCLGIDNASQGFLRIRDPLKGGKPSQYHPWLPNRTESSDAIIQASKSVSICIIYSNMHILLGRDCSGAHTAG
jgi:hypothetical protein